MVPNMVHVTLGTRPLPVSESQLMLTVHQITTFTARLSGITRIHRDELMPI